MSALFYKLFLVLRQTHNCPMPLIFSRNRQILNEINILTAKKFTNSIELKQEWGISFLEVRQFTEITQGDKRTSGKKIVYQE